jgi:hypothetical protein
MDKVSRLLKIIAVIAIVIAMLYQGINHRLILLVLRG